MNAFGHHIEWFYSACIQSAQSALDRDFSDRDGSPGSHDLVAGLFAARTAPRWAS
jgi:hypothetical protein